MTMQVLGSDEKPARLWVALENVIAQAIAEFETRTELKVERVTLERPTIEDFCRTIVGPLTVGVDARPK